MFGEVKVLQIGEENYKTEYEKFLFERARHSGGHLGVFAVSKYDEKK